MDWISDPQAWIGFATLTVLEIVLGIDNIIFISILAGKLPAAQQRKARLLGLGLAMVMRIAPAASRCRWIVRLTAPLFTVLGQEISGRDLILLVGGLFLIGKATHEIHGQLEGEEGEASRRGSALASRRASIQIMLLDIVFSLDSVITAVGMVDEIGVMIAAVVVAVGVMMVFVRRDQRVRRAGTPRSRCWRCSFLILIGVTLVAEGFDQHIPKGYIYFAMAFSVMVEMLNLRTRTKKAEPVHLRQVYTEERPVA